MTKHEGLAMVYVLQKFRDYLLRGHLKMYIDHPALKYLVKKIMLGKKICRWLLLFQVYDFEVTLKRGMLNARLDHLSRIETVEEPNNLEEGFPDAQLFVVRIADDHFADIIHFLTTGMALEGYKSQQKKELVVRTTDFSIIAGHLYKMGADEILRRYVPEFECDRILTEAHGGAAGGHYAGKATAHNILHVGLWWPTL